MYVVSYSELIFVWTMYRVEVYINLVLHVARPTGIVHCQQSSIL